MRIVKQSITDQLYIGLKEEIIRQKIPYGAQINPKEIAQEYDVSVMPVRDALTRLASYGLVTIKPRKGFFVKVFTEREIREIFEMRMLLETYCMEHYFENIDKASVERLKAAMETCDHNLSREQFDEMDENLHDLLIAASKNQFLIASYSRVRDIIIFIRHLDLRRMDISHEEHKELVDVILQNDKSAALACLKLHLDSVRDSTLRELKKHEPVANLS
ncbi:MAG: GntR family transcriptional regulator [Limnochordia bacterium]|jgi:DNA-binding GntR family transcriptional regulator